METPYVSLKTAARLHKKYPGCFPGNTPSAFDLIENLTTRGFVVQIGSLHFGSRAIWTCEMVWRGQTARGKVFYSEWNLNLAEALAEVFESYLDHIKGLEQQSNG